jgi:peroxiredoxin
MTGIAGEDRGDKGAGVARFAGIVNLSLVSVLLFASVVLNVFLARKVSMLRATIEAFKSEGRLQVGTKVPVIEGLSVDGTNQTLDYGSVRIPTVLYVFTPQCGWCAKNVENLRTLIANSGSGYRVIGISLTKQDLKKYLEKERLSLPVYTDVGDSTRIAYRLGGTPTTIVISPEATVLKVWSGAYTDGIRQEIESYLRVQLPGCCKESVADQQGAHSN